MTDALQIDFYAHLSEKGQTVGFYNDGCGRIVLETDISQLPEIMKVIAYGREKSFRVTVTISDPQQYR